MSRYLAIASRSPLQKWCIPQFRTFNLKIKSQNLLHAILIKATFLFTQSLDLDIFEKIAAELPQIEVEILAGNYANRVYEKLPPLLRKGNY